MDDQGPKAHSLETERYVLSVCLQWPAIIDELLDYLDVDDWYLEKHANAWKAFIRLSARRDAINYLSLYEDLRAHGLHEEWSGIDEIIALSREAPTRAGIKNMALLVAGLARVRRVTDEATRIAVRGRSGEYGDVEGFIEDAEARIVAATQGRRIADVSSLADCVGKTMSWLTALESKKLSGFGVETCFSQLNEWTSGLQGGDLCIVAAPTSHGKTALAMQMALNAKVATLYCALEQSRKQLALRCMASESGLPMYRVRNPQYWSKDTSGKILDAVHRLEKIPLFMDDRARISPMQMRSTARRLYKKHKLGLLIGDYLQIFKPSVMKKGQSREQEVAAMSSEFKELGRELDIPVVMLSQLNRQWNARSDKRPVLSDLRESGAIEQDADQVIFIYRPDKKDGYGEGQERAEIVLAKNRNGPCGTVNATWDPVRMRFADKPFDGPREQKTTNSGIYPDDE